MQVLVVNVGSTSLKFRLFRMEDEEILAAGRVERVGSPSSPYNYRRGQEPELTGDLECRDQRAAVDHALKLLTDPATGVLNSLEELDAVGFKPVSRQGDRRFGLHHGSDHRRHGGVHVPGARSQSALHTGVSDIPGNPA